MKTVVDANEFLTRSWVMIIDECRAVLGGELHYQAVVYHCLRQAGVPRTQLGMNVKQWLTEPVSDLFKLNDLRKHENFRGGFEPIPDVVLFKPEIEADWRRRNRILTVRHMLLAIEVKASERSKSRLSAKEVIGDTLKLAAHRDEVAHRGGAMHPVMMVIDTAPLTEERMRPDAIDGARETALNHGVRFMYVSRDVEMDIGP